MTTYTMPISMLINVNLSYQAPLLQPVNFGRALIIGSSENDRDAANELFGIYNTIDAVKADYGVEAPEYAIAKRYFQQNPRPKDIMIATIARSP
mgnify:CR=1 FL=1